MINNCLYRHFLWVLTVEITENYKYIPQCVHPLFSWPEKTFWINIEITNVLKHVCMTETVLSLGRAIYTGYEIQTNDCINCL